jgi:hypothetical protein
MITPSFNLTATERVLPRMALDFTTASLDSRVTFTRAGGTATRVNASGLIDYVAANTARFDFDPTTLVCKGLLIEEARTNIVIQSDALNSGAYATSNATVGTNAVVSPDGTLNAETVTTGASGTGQIFGISALLPVTPATDYTVSFYAKNISATYVVYGVLKATPTAAWIVDIADSANNYISQINGSTWTRIKFSFNSGTATSINLYLAANLPATQSLSLWGVQLEAGAFATSYIRTTGSQVTRTTDVATMTGTNFSSWFNASEGAFAYWTNVFSDNSSVLLQCSKAGSGYAELLSIQREASLDRWQLLGYEGGVLRSNLLTVTNSFTINSNNKCVHTYKSASYAGSANATTLRTSTGNIPSGLDRLAIGHDVVGSGSFISGYVQKIMYWPQRLTNDEVLAFSKG